MTNPPVPLRGLPARDTKYFQEVKVNREQKAQEVKFLADRVSKAKALVFAGYRGLKVSEMTDLRSKLRKGQSTIKVVKNRLMKRVFKEQGLENLDEYFSEPTALAASEADPVSPVKVLVDFAKANNRLQIKGGFMDGKVLSIKELDRLAQLPSREVLLAKALGSMQAPASNIVGVLAAVPRKLLYALNAIKDTKQ